MRSTRINRLGVIAAALPASGLVSLAAVRGPHAPPEMALKNGDLVPAAPTKSREEATGLLRLFPPIPMRADNPTTPARAALGRLLFFDPILSGNNKMSCANCHHPDLGFSDGLPRARGYGSVGYGPSRRGGVELTRRPPTLWNAFYNQRQFWDGRASDLEDQAQSPITASDEMGSTREQVVAKLAAIPQYVKLFRTAFPDRAQPAITFEHVTYAIAAFERTLVANNTPYDCYAAGDAHALTASAVRGLKLFLSSKTRCSECHGLPTFANADFKVIGVPNPPNGPPDQHKPGAAPDRGGGPDGAYKIPTLRNVALRGPYMHNGTLATLNDVLDFYSKGGGRGRGLTVAYQDDKIRKYKLTASERNDLIAFLYSLTDTSAMPEFPRRVPSGLPVVGHVRRKLPPGVLAAIAGHAPAGAQAAFRPVQVTLIGPQRVPTVEVRPGQSIQDAVEAAGAGGVVRIHPGVYHESVLVARHHVTIEGVPENGPLPVMDGGGDLADAILAVGDDFTLRNIAVRHYQGNGVLATGSHGVTFRAVTVDDTGSYGIYPVDCNGVTVDGCVVSGSHDAGIYVGQSLNIVVRNSEVHGNVAGIEIENSAHALVENNTVHDNTGGILVFVLPNNLRKDCHDTLVRGNRVFRNNTPNFADPNAFVRNVLAGTGVMVFGSTHTTVIANDMTGNGSFAVAVTGLRTVFGPRFGFDVDPNPSYTVVRGNILQDNGNSPDPRLAKYGVPGRELIWDLSGTANVWDQPGATSFPPRLPGPPASGAR